MSTSTPSIDFGTDGYRAGVCNIGPAEVRRRRLAAVAAIIGAAAVAVLLVAVEAPPLARLLFIVPLYGVTTTSYQALARFCLGFAMTGLQNFGALGGQQRIADDAARRADRAKALRAVALCGVLAVAGGIAFALLPI